MTHRLVMAALAAVLVCTTAQGDYEPADPPQGLFDDNYYAIELLGRKCGYARFADKREGDVIRTLNYMNITIKRGPAAVNMVIKSVHRETVDGRPLGFEAEQYTGMMTVKYTGQIRDGQLELISRQGEQQTVRSYEWDRRAQLAWGNYLTIHKRGLRVGDEFDMFGYDVMVRPDKAIPTHFRVLSYEPVELLGSKVPAFKVETTTDVGMKLTSTSWLRDDGVPLMTTVSLGFINLKLLRCPKEFALQDLSPPELMAGTLIRADRPINGAKASRIVYRLSLPDGAESLELPSTAMQRVLGRQGKSVRLEVRRAGGAGRSTADAKPEPSDMNRYLASTLYLKHDDPLIEKMAAEARGDESDPRRVAARLREYVTREVATKDLSIGFATASEVAKMRQGDCSEHAVLLAALARACGMPSRVVIGMVHVDELLGQRNIFGYHMWTQVYLDGRWLDVDAALGQTDCDPTHIALELSDLTEGGLTSAALRLLPVIGKLKIEVLEVE